MMEPKAATVCPVTGAVAAAAVAGLISPRFVGKAKA